MHAYICMHVYTCMGVYCACILMHGPLFVGSEVPRNSPRLSQATWTDPEYELKLCSLAQGFWSL